MMGALCYHSGFSRYSLLCFLEKNCVLKLVFETLKRILKGAVSHAIKKNNINKQ